MQPSKVFFNLIKKWEGGEATRSYAEDPGGHTKHGVTIGYWNSVAHNIVGKPPGDASLSTITWDDAEKISKVGFWDKYKIDTIRNPALRIMVAEAIWGSGIGGGLKSFGYTSIKDLNRDIFATPLKLYKKRLAWLKTLSNWKYNGKGWTNRLNDDLKAARKIQRTRMALMGAGLLVVGTGGYFTVRAIKNR
jgi:lysozyme family protein